MAQQLNGCITFWEVKLAQDSYLMAPATKALIENTVRYLKELEKLREEVKQRPKAKFPDTKAEKIKLVRAVLENSGYEFKHPTLILEGEDGWFVILTPHRSPHQAMVHYDGKISDFFATVPEAIE